jgi:hypothetical protein
MDQMQGGHAPMTVLRKPDLPELLRSEMARLVMAGLPILPLGGADGKSPLVKDWAKGNLSLSRVLAPMSNRQSFTYGIRLDQLLVLDFDTDDSALIARMEARFGPSPIHVRTPRGWHLYYAAGGIIPALKTEGLPVDVKTGPRAYVVGPLAERPDGGRYAYAKGRLGVDRLRPLRASQGSETSPVAVGERHKRLLKEARSMVEFVDTLPELVGNLLAFRADCLPESESVADTEVQGIACYFWNLRLEGRLSKGRDSEFCLHRATLDALADAPNRSDTVALFVTLQDLHGHSHGKRFPLVWKAMRDAGHTDLSRPRFDAAKRVMREKGAIEMVSKHRAGSRPQLFVLKRVRPNLALTENVVLLQRSHQGGKPRGEG